jgi:23S rRNA (adenine2030-N6)-methyltransferase
MNYRHSFHAGNFADVLKHGVLARVLEYLAAKDKPFTVIDTHAGAGLYDLEDSDSNRTLEYRDGIARILNDAQAPAFLAPYFRTVDAENPAGGLRHYPGSPVIARRLLRRGDHLMLCELHAPTRALLEDVFAHDKRTRIFDLDAYTAVKSFLPPTPRRGLLLIDPPFEKTDEFDRLAAAVADMLERWAGGILIAWFPIKQRRAVADFKAQVAALPLPSSLWVELLVRGEEDQTRFNGCGLLILNPPWTLFDELAVLLPYLKTRLAQTGGARFALERLGRREADAGATPSRRA